MNIALLHYHLRPGGVTTVIKHQVKALGDRAQVLVISSHAPEGPVGAEVAVVPLTAYSAEIKCDFGARDLADGIEAAVRRKWPGGCDVLHVHNPTLVKNHHMPAALEILRDRGMRLFLQVHDFAEDGRPAAYYGRDYPADVHYGVINSRDFSVMEDAGLKKEGLHMIPNQVRPFDVTRPTRDGYVLYPVRALRRKNIGEALLLSLFLREDQTIGVTLPPTSAGDRGIYRQWQSFAGAHDFNVRLGVGQKEDFHELIRRARFFITTSVNEGFGFAFLEPWTAGHPVVGRYLEHVCRDFEERGVNLDHLYRALYVPLECIDADAFYCNWSDSFTQLAGPFGFKVEEGVMKRAFGELTADNAIDFGMLDEATQMRALAAAKKDRKCYRRILQLNPGLDALPDFQGHHPGVTHNNEIIRRHYGEASYRDRLLDIYGRVMSVAVSQQPDRRIMLERFLNPLEYKILRWKDGQ